MKIININTKEILEVEQEHLIAVLKHNKDYKIYNENLELLNIENKKENDIHNQNQDIEDKEEIDINNQNQEEQKNEEKRKQPTGQHAGSDQGHGPAGSAVLLAAVPRGSPPAHRQDRSSALPGRTEGSRRGHPATEERHHDGRRTWLRNAI